jgi:methylthioribose-1-phosphate isomerase
LETARAICRDDIARNQALGAHGAPLLPVDGAVLTHCNAGSLACVGYGTALGVIRAAHDAGRRPRVWAGETRPLLQGARLTMWELDRLGIDGTLVPDGAAAALMSRGLVDTVIVGADRIAANGDTANKIGTYGLAVVARAHQIPFYVAAPVSTIDLATPAGDAITIEERDPDEVMRVGTVRTAPATSIAYNPAFDVTPARLITAIITDRGVARRPYTRSLATHHTDACQR